MSRNRHNNFLRAAYAALFTVVSLTPLLAQTPAAAAKPPAAKAAVAKAAPPAAAMAGAAKVTSVEGITEYRLANGLRVLLFPDPTKTNATVNITYMVGSRNESYGETGMAHLLEHMMFKGSTHHPNVPKELQDHGARFNGTTSFDRTNYFETLTATGENLNWALSMEADRMVNSFIAKKDLDTEMTVVRNEFEMGENSPQNILEERVLSTAFLWHNYGHSTIGARSDIELVPIERLQAFWRQFYQPDNALLVVAGKIDEAKTLALVDKYFAPIPKPTRELRRTYTIEPTQDGERSVTLRRNGDTQAAMAVYHIPSGTDPDFAAVDLASDILGDAPGGRLYKALVDTKKAASVETQTYQLKEPGMFEAMAEVRLDQSVTEARDILIATIEGLAKQPFTSEELERVRTKWLKNFDLAMNNSQSVALQLSEWQAQGDWRLMFLHRDRVKAVKLEQVQKAAEKYFVQSNRTSGIFIPDKNPVRAEVPNPPDVNALVKDYKGNQTVEQGEAFDASPANIDKRTVRGSIGGIKTALLQKKTRGNQVIVMLQLHFGDEKTLQGREMAASMAGQMLMRGTAKHTRQQLKDAFDKLKAQVSIGGAADSALARVTTTKENLKPVLDLVAEVLREPAFPQDEFDKLKTEELAQLESNKSEPQALAMIDLQKHLSSYPKGDPRYVSSIDEQIEETKAVTLDQATSFYKEFYGASNGELSIIGDFDAALTQNQIKTLFGDWNSPKSFKRIELSYQSIKPLVQAIETPDKANTMWVAGALLKLSDTDPDYPAMVLGNYVLGGGFNSHLFARIRGKEGLSYGVGSGLQVTPKEDVGKFFAYALCAPQNAPKVEASFKDEVKKILDAGYTAAEVEAAKKSWQEGRQIARANDSELVGRLASGLFFGRTLAFDAELEAKVKALTPEQIKAAMKKLIDVDALSYVRAGDFKKANVTW
ncbi:MAG: pitrilysin family protein [Bryobacteraceae bacterium]|nr:pitrilysin family protein [Bryobacteraceae bacterium]